MTNVTRRQFLKSSAGAAAILAAGCDSRPEPTQTAPQSLAEKYASTNNPGDPQNLFNLLSTTEFMDQDGQKINMEGLRARLQNKFTTLTFGFGKCDQLCPTINSNLGKLNKMSPDVASIIVSVDPEHDNSSPEAREAYKAGLKARGVEGIILYPKSSSAATQLAAAMGAITNPVNPQAHDGNIVLYAPGGRKLGKVFGMSSFEKIEREWGPIINDTSVQR